MKNEAEVFINSQNELGEGPEWQPSKKRLSWVDIIGKKIGYYNFSENTRGEFPVNNVIGFAIPTNQEDVYITGQLDEIVLVDIKMKTQRSVLRIPENLSYNRFNDAKCDRKGRLLAGTASQDFNVSSAGFYQIDNQWKFKTIFNNVGCSNGLCWSSDHRTIYYIDSNAMNLKCFEYIEDTGELRNGKIILEWPKAAGYLDGMTIDKENKLWIALWGGNGVIRFCPKQKKIISNVVVNAKHTSSVVFGGAKMKTIFITSARVGLTLDEIKKNPLEGAIFAFDTDTEGALNYPFLLEAENIIFSNKIV